MDDQLARRTADLAVGYLREIRERPVRERADARGAPRRLPRRRSTIGRCPLPPQVIEELAPRAAEPGLLASQSPRYFGFVIGGALDSAVAADWLTSAWDQNGGGYPVGPSHGDRRGGRVRLAARRAAAAGRRRASASRPGARWRTSRAWPPPVTACWRTPAGTSSSDGLFGAPPIRVVLGENAHATVFAALRMLGLGSRRVTLVPADDQGRMRADELRLTDEPTIVIAQVGEVNTGAIDPMPEITARAREHGAWCHVDGAFGLWAAASPNLRPPDRRHRGRRLVGHRRPQAPERAPTTAASRSSTTPRRTGSRWTRSAAPRTSRRTGRRRALARALGPRVLAPRARLHRLRRAARTGP